MPKKPPPEPIVEALAIAVPPQQAWEALTSARVLGDIVMGHVEMDSRPGRQFSWDWGTWAKAAPGKAAAKGFTWKARVLDAVPGSTLVLGGAGGPVATFTVKGEGNASLVTIVQGGEKASLEDFRYGWADFLLKLKTRLERSGQPGSIYLRTLVRATPAEVLRAWLSPAAIGKILPGKAKIQAKKGGRFEWTWKHGASAKETGKFIEIVKGHRVAFTWEGTPLASEVRLSAERTPYGTLVALEHLLAGPGRGGLERRWAHLLERLRAYFFYGKNIRTT